MKLVTTTHLLEERFGLKAAIRMIKDAGFDGYDCSLFESMKPGKPLALTAYLEYAHELRDYADKIGIPCTQTHAPYPSLLTIEDIDNVVETQLKAIEISAILGAEIIVIHPASCTDVRGNFDHLYSKLIPRAEELGIKIATENMFTSSKQTHELIPAACGTVDEFCSYVDYAKSKYFTACLDIGHSELKKMEGAVRFINGMGSERISALHIHDNNGISDQHVMPFAGKINWDEVTRALAQIDYKGNFTFEADTTADNYPDELLAGWLRLLYKTGHHLINKIESYIGD